jgi:hypothetical protein
MNIYDCFKKRLLRTIPPDKEKARRSLEIAEDKLKTAKDAFGKKFFDFCIIY